MNWILRDEKRDRRDFIFSILGFALLLPLRVANATEEQKLFTINIKNGHLPKDQQTIRVTQGDIVEIKFTSDNDLTLHLHGINIETIVTPEKPSVMSFDAKVAGRFPIEIHGNGAHGKLMYVEVYPQ